MCSAIPRHLSPFRGRRQMIGRPSTKRRQRVFRPATQRCEREHHRRGFVSKCRSANLDKSRIGRPGSTEPRGGNSRLAGRQRALPANLRRSRSPPVVVFRSHHIGRQLTCCQANTEPNPSTCRSTRLDLRLRSANDTDALPQNVTKCIL